MTLSCMNRNLIQVIPAKIRLSTPEYREEKCIDFGQQGRGVQLDLRTAQFRSLEISSDHCLLLSFLHPAFSLCVHSWFKKSKVVFFNLHGCLGLIYNICPSDMGSSFFLPPNE